MRSNIATTLVFGAKPYRVSRGAGSRFVTRCVLCHPRHVLQLGFAEFSCTHEYAFRARPMIAVSRERLVLGEDASAALMLHRSPVITIYAVGKKRKESIPTFQAWAPGYILPQCIAGCDWLGSVKTCIQRLVFKGDRFRGRLVAYVG